MIERAIATFVGLLNSNWTGVQGLAEVTGHEGLTADWMQASWETIVEASLPLTTPPMRLVVYGDGADCHPSSSRVSFSEDLPTCEVSCELVNDYISDYLSGNVMPKMMYVFDRFVSVKDGWYFERHPFDHVLLERDGHKYVVGLGEVIWKVNPCQQSR